MLRGGGDDGNASPDHRMGGVVGLRPPRRAGRSSHRRPVNETSRVELPNDVAVVARIAAACAVRQRCSRHAARRVDGRVPDRRVEGAPEAQERSPLRTFFSALSKVRIGAASK